MRTPPALPGTLRKDPQWLILIAAVALAAFHYLARADTIGVFSTARGWSALTGTPLRPVLHFAGSALLLGILPVIIARRLTGLSLAELGLGSGRRRLGLTWLAVGIPAALLAGKIGSMSPGMRSVYPLDPTVSIGPPGLVRYLLLQFLYYGAWEVLFRGVLLFGLRGHLGAGAANMLQTALSVVAHFGRPFQETLAAVPAGLAFGWINLRVGSIWYIAVVHWLVGVSLDWFILTT